MNIHNDARMFSLLRRSGSIKSVFVFATAFIVVHGGRRMALDPNSATVAVDIVLVILGEEYLMSDHAVQKVGRLLVARTRYCSPRNQQGISRL